MDKRADIWAFGVVLFEMALIAIQKMSKAPQETVSTTATAWQSVRLPWAARAIRPSAQIQKLTTASLL